MLTVSPQPNWKLILKSTPVQTRSTFR
jgi:hypothetical protein